MGEAETAADNGRTKYTHMAHSVMVTYWTEPLRCVKNKKEHQARGKQRIKKITRIKKILNKWLERPANDIQLLTKMHRRELCGRPWSLTSPDMAPKEEEEGRL